ncbi:MAG: adenosylcobinamide-phosphate synthase CbiB [Candidatus Sphingomonas phytovorans]|nr:adenosylcobinamide-phosphate synthase CbiB [Sphingomonas sp.]WEJ99704.1 MAG: adenosylcobinamide-phosphate synthase CbiB [Sphingomonas sp.]
MAEPVALAALVLDAGIGWPDALYRRIGHPVGGFARIIGWCERRWNAPSASPTRRRVLGLTTLLIVAGTTFGIALAATALVRFLMGDLAWIGLAVLAFPGLAQRSLHDHVAPVATALATRDLPRARAAVAMIVGRDVEALEGAGIARAAIESLAESFCDGVVAPLFWLLVLGVPGLWAYKAINTADSLIGHREERWRAFGWASARTDDLANLIPARLAGLLLCLAGGGGLTTMFRDARKHASPNAGWPEAAMAGALDLRLAGPVAYDGVMLDKDWIGSGRSEATASDLQRALTTYRIACLLLWLIAGGVAWAL